MGRHRAAVRLATACLAVTCLSVGCSSGVDNYTPVTAETTTAPYVQPLSSLLDQQDRPVNLFMVGDGTGSSLGGWVFLTMQELAARTGRSADIHEWDFASGAGYLEPPVHVIDGAGPPITLWNASISQNVGFFTDSLPRMRPTAEIDVVLVNNGLDMGPNTLASESIPLLRRIADEFPAAAVVAVLQPAPREPEELADRVRSNVHDLEVSCRINDIQTIDVASALADDPGMYDGESRYANFDGQRRWTMTMVDGLSSDVMVPAE